MGHTATITHESATLTQWTFDPVTKRAIITGAETGERVQEHTAASLNKLTELSVKEGQVNDKALEPAAHFEEKRKSVAALDQATPAQPNNSATPGFIMVDKPGR